MAPIASLIRTAGLVSAEQIVVTHCLKEDSVLGQGGFSVRAASTSDRELLGWALRQLEQYELPLEMQRGTVLVSQTPRRLALIPAPGNRAALVHSSYLPGDSCQPPRPHSFVTHILVYQELDALPAAASWHASDWQRHAIDQGASKVLDPLEGVPQGVMVNDGALTDLLSGSIAPNDQSISNVLFPSRLERDLESRRRIVRATLEGFLRTFDPGAARRRVCVLAEPGTVALLAYAVARVLPTSIAGSFWFSTYEPPHSSLREHRTARLVGSFTPRPIDRSESDSLKRNGFIIDALRTPSNCGPDLPASGSNWPLEPLLDLAAAGDWSAIDRVCAAWSASPPPPNSTALAAALSCLRRQDAPRHDTAARGAGSDSLSGTAQRPTLEPAWTGPVDPSSIDLATDIEREPLETWRAELAAIREIEPGERKVLLFEKLLGTIGAGPAVASLHSEDRLELLAEWSGAYPPEAARPPLPETFHWLLIPPTEEEFLALVGSPSLEPRHAGLALCLAVSGRSGWAAGPALFQGLEPTRLAAFLALLEGFPGREELLRRLFPAADPAAESLALRFLDTPPAGSDGWFEAVLMAARCDAPSWRPRWLTGRRFETLLGRLPRGSNLGQRIGRGLLDRVSPDNFDDDTRITDLGVLVAACERFPESLARDDRNRFDGWRTLRAHFLDPDVGSAGVRRLRESCRVVGHDRDALAEASLRRRYRAARSSHERAAQLEHVARVVRGLHATDAGAARAAAQIGDRLGDPALARNFTAHVAPADQGCNTQYDATGNPIATLSQPAIERFRTARSDPSSDLGRAATARMLDRVLFLLLGVLLTVAAMAVLLAATGRGFPRPIPAELSRSKAHAVRIEGRLEEPAQEAEP